MAGMGTGYPVRFHCPTWRHENNDHHFMPNHYPPARRHAITLTGRTRPAPSPGKGHPRKSKLSREWTCECGKTGWSCHKDLERMEARG